MRAVHERKSHAVRTRAQSPPRPHSAPAQAHAAQRARTERVSARNQCTQNESVRCTLALLARTQRHGHEPLSSTSGLAAALLPSAFDMQVEGCSGRKPCRTKVHREMRPGTNRMRGCSVAKSCSGPTGHRAHVRQGTGTMREQLECRDMRPANRHEHKHDLESTFTVPAAAFLFMRSFGSIALHDAFRALHTRDAVD